MATLAGELLIKMGLDVAQLKRDTGEANRTVKEMSNGFQQAATVAKSAMAGIAAAFSVDTIKQYVQQSINALDAINDLQKRSGMAAQALLELQGAAARAGESTEGLDGLLSKLPKKLSEAADEATPLGQLFKKLGLDAKAGLGDMQGFLEKFGEVLKGFEDGPDKAALAIEVLAKGGDKFIGTLEGLSEMRDRYRELGITIDADAVKAADRFNDTMQDVEDLSKATARQLASGLLPSLNDLVAAFVDAKKGGMDFTSVGQAIGQFFRTTAGEAIALAGVFKQLGGEFTALANLFKNRDLPASEALKIYGQDRNIAAKMYQDAVASAKNLMAPPAVSNAELNALADGVTGQQKKRAPSVGGAAGGGADSILKKQQETLIDIQRQALKAAAATEEELATFETLKGKFKDYDATAKQTIITEAKRRDLYADAVKDASKLAAIENEIAKANQDIVASLRAEEEARRKQIDDLLKQTPTAQQEDRARQQRELDERLLDGLINEKQHREATDILQGLRNEAKETKDIFTELGATFESAFEKAIDSGGNFSDFMQGLGKDLTKILMREFVTGPLIKQFKDMLSDIKKEMQAATGSASPSFGGGGGSVFGLFKGLWDTFGGVLGGSSDPGGSFSEGNYQTKSAVNVYIDSRTDQAAVRAEAEKGVSQAMANIADARVRGNAAFA